jgi:hypothetical protein
VAAHPAALAACQDEAGPAHKKMITLAFGTVAVSRAGAV